MTLHTAITIVCAAGATAFVAHEAWEFVLDKLYGARVPPADRHCRIMRELPDDATSEWRLGRAL